jgi:NACHT domain
VGEPPVDDLLALEDIRVPGSCEWLMMKQPYYSWRTVGPGSKPILWLTGSPGSGKSVLCSHIINDLQSHNLRSSYFFFKHGNVTKSTISGCLRAMAYQIAQSDDAVLQRVLEFGQDTSSWEHWDERTIWRKLFIGCIFEKTSQLPQFWVIDALDECQKVPLFLTLIAKIPSYLRIILTSRNSPEIEQGLATLGPLAERYQVRAEDTTVDLSIFVNSKMDCLPAGDYRSRVKLKERILRKASGSFLWVSLIIRELENVYSEESIEEVLDDVPADMNKLYSRVLESVARNGRATRLAKSIFMWTLLSRRTLTLPELQHAIKLDINETVPNLGKSIPAICGQLVCVDQSNRAQCIHQTAQAFLLRQDLYSNLAVNKKESHNRIAEICLRFLSESLVRGTRLRKMKPTPATLGLDAEFAEYACFFFSDHLQRCSFKDEKTWNLLCEFLTSNVLSWIEYLASAGKIHHITRTG